jgi:16S rRNA (uracil1498-N3)-methyltransferase
MSGSIRLYVTESLRQAAGFDATAAQAHYLGSVMRRSAGDAVRLFNGRDGEWQGRIERLGRGAARLMALAPLRPQAAEADLWLAFCLLKRDATDLVVEKATELGASALLPVVSERTNTARLNEARLLAIAIEAAEQCDRLTVPRIAPPRRLAALLGDWPQDRPLVAAMERQAVAPLRPVAGPAALLVGPEGGFTTAELDALRACPFVVPASLGARILRAETAAIVGLALLQAPPAG